MKKYIYDVPETQGVANVLKRARQLTDITWFPLKKMPFNCVQRPTAESKATYLPSYTGTNLPMTGMVYSSCRLSEKYVGYNVSIETFMTAMQNPNSVLYTKTLHGTGGSSMGTWYGTVCSAFASYCLDLPTRRSCRLWFGCDDVEEVDKDRPEDFRLGDVVVNSKHIGVITAIGRDDRGRVQTVTVAESVVPTVRELEYPLHFFYAHWDGYSVLRYKHIDKVTYAPTPFVYVEDDPDEDAPEFEIMTNWGNKANVLLGREEVELSALRGVWETFAVTMPDGTEMTYPAGQAIKVQTPMPGRYTAAAKNGNAVSAAVTWHCCDFACKADKAAYKVGEPITLTFSSTEKDKVFSWIINKEDNYLKIRGDVKEHGSVTVPGIDAPGRYWGAVMAKNEFGTYVSHRFDIEVTE